MDFEQFFSVFVAFLYLDILGWTDKFTMDSENIEGAEDDVVFDGTLSRRTGIGRVSDM